MRVKGRGKIGGGHRFPFIIPATCGRSTGARQSQLGHIMHVPSFFSSSTTIYAVKPQTSYRKLHVFGITELLFTLSEIRMDT
jgi:hypothetical protein